MLLSPNRSFCLPIKPCVGKYCSKTNDFARKNDVVPYKRYSRSFTRRRCHPLSSRYPEAAPADPDAGIGILEFFEGKNIFLTGATGLLGKVFLEKILRSTSVGKVYSLIKAKDKEAAFDRIEHEIINSDLLACLKEKYGKSYGGFVREKLIPIVGDICKPNLGMDYECSDAVRKDVDVIIHSAANTTFNERYDLIVDANVIAPQRLVRFAKTCHKLQLFTHVSTSYVSGKREGIILEKPLIMGDSGILKEGDGVDVADEISLLLRSSTDVYDNGTKYFRNLGQQRAEFFGWNTVYQLSKGMGEMVVNEIRGDIPLLIIRPAIIESCYREPLPGWIQGNRMFDPVSIAYGKGLLPAYLANPQVPLDLIPADLVANTMIAAIAKHGNTLHTPQVNVYHVASGLSNPLTHLDAFEYLYQYFKAAPLTATANIAKIEFFDHFDNFSQYTKEKIVGCNTDRKMIRQCNAQVEYAKKICKLYEFVGFFKARFDTSNIDKLIEEMSEKERLNFEVDIRNIDWKRYFLEIHIPGLKKHVINST